MAWKWLDRLRGIEDRAVSVNGVTFLLKKKEMIGRDVFVYTATRAQARLGLRTGGFWYTKKGVSGSTLTSVTARAFGDGHLKIGCQYFYEPEADKLRAWAFKE